MASIIKNEEQVKALHEINSSLETLETLSAIMTAEKPFLGADIGTGKARVVHVRVDEKERKQFVSICEKAKTRLAKEIIAKADKYKIQLDETELALLGETR